MLGCCALRAVLCARAARTMTARALERMGGHDGLRPGGVPRTHRGDDLQVVAEAAPQRRPRRRRGSSRRTMGGWMAAASAVASVGWAASAMSRSWKARLRGTRASRSWSGPGLLRRRHIRRASDVGSDDVDISVAFGNREAGQLRFQRGNAGRRHPRARRRSRWRRGRHGWRRSPPAPRPPSRVSASRTGVRLTPETLGELDLAEPGTGRPAAPLEDQLRAAPPERPLARGERPCHSVTLPWQDCVQT